METTKSIKQILATMESSPEKITVKPPNAKWNETHLRLNVGSNSKLKELEDEAGMFCFEMWANPKYGRLLVLAGKNGTGKTHVAKAVRDWIRKVGHAKQFIQEPGVILYLECIYWPWAELLDTFKNGGWDVLADMFTIPCLIIDDLGAGHDPSGIGNDKLCQVLSKREKKWTLITTNIIPSQWREKFDQRIASRFFRNSTIVDLSEVPDYSL